MWVFPFLHYVHQYPLTTFYQEWWSALLGVLALVLLLSLDYWQQPKIPRIVLLPAAFMGLILLQNSLGKLPYFDQALLYLLYFLFALLMMRLGARLREVLGLQVLAMVLAVFLLAGAESNAVIGVLQYYRWHTPFDTLIVSKVAAGVYGNIAQPNHFANYISLGLISLGLLYQLRKIPTGAVFMLALPLLFVLTLSGSRSSWIYLVMMNVLAVWGGRRFPELQPLLKYNLGLLVGFAAMHGVVQLPFMQGAGDHYNIMHRMFADAQSGGIRLSLWHEAWLIFCQSPVFGVGFGQFVWQHFELGPVLHRTQLTGLYNNAHNFVFQLAAEAGVTGVLAFLAALGLWLQGLRRTVLSADRWWAYAVLGVLAIHSLLEYPLWYIYFVAIAAILLGALDETHYRLELRRIGQLSMASMLLLGLLSLIQVRMDYQKLKDTLGFQSRAGLIALQDAPLLLPYVELFMTSLIEVNADHQGEKLALNARVIRFMPISSVVYRQAFLLAQNGQKEQAQQQYKEALWSYPDYQSAHQKLVVLAQKDPAHFAALLEFALKSEQEYLRAIHNK